MKEVELRGLVKKWKAAERERQQRDAYVREVEFFARDDDEVIALTARLYPAVHPNAQYWFVDDPDRDEREADEAWRRRRDEALKHRRKISTRVRRIKAREAAWVRVNTPPEPTIEEEECPF